MTALSFRAAAAVRALLVLISVAMLSACGGSSSSTGNGVPPLGGFCDPGTSVQLARPNPNQAGVPTSTSSIEIVASGNNNTLYSSYQSFELIAVPQFGNQITTGGLSLVSDSSGPHPFQSDFYYSGTLSGGLSPGQLYVVYLNSFTSNCQPIAIGQFST
jgi:hypothetical protein